MAASARKIRTSISLLLILLALPAAAEDFHQRLDTTPDISIGLGSAGTHPCVVAQALALGITGAGAGIGFGRVIEDCETRNWIALLYNIGQPELALTYAQIVNPRVQVAIDVLASERPRKRKVSVSEIAAGLRDIEAEIHRYMRERDG